MATRIKKRSEKQSRAPRTKSFRQNRTCQRIGFRVYDHRPLGTRNAPMGTYFRMRSSSAGSSSAIWLQGAAYKFIDFPPNEEVFLARPRIDGDRRLIGDVHGLQLFFGKLDHGVLFGHVVGF